MLIIRPKFRINTVKFTATLEAELVYGEYIYL